MKDVTFKQREQARLQVINSVLEYQLPRAQAAELLGISERQLRRVLAAYRRDGAAALVHGNRGRKPHNAIPEDVAAAAVILASEKYVGFNHSHFTEVLAEREGIHLSRQTESRLLNHCGLTSARRYRPPRHGSAYPGPVATGLLIIAYTPDNPNGPTEEITQKCKAFQSDRVRCPLRQPSDYWELSQNYQEPLRLNRDCLRPGFPLPDFTGTDLGERLSGRPCVAANVIHNGVSRGALWHRNVCRQLTGRPHLLKAKSPASSSSEPDLTLK